MSRCVPGRCGGDRSSETPSKQVRHRALERRATGGSFRPLRQSKAILSARTMNLRHIVVTDGGRLAVVPINRDAAPRRAPDRALVFYVAPPGNSIPCLQLSRFFTGHYWRAQASQWTRKPYNYHASEREKPPLGWSAAALR
jgi:hypothetical protein